MTRNAPDNGRPPALSLQFADPGQRRALGTSVELRSTVLAPAFDLAQVGQHTRTRRGANPWARVDGPYRRAFFYYHEFTEFYSPLGFVLESAGPDDLSGVRVEAVVPAAGGVQVAPAWEQPSKPAPFPLRTRMRDPRHSLRPGSVKVQETRDGWLLQADLEDVKAGESAWTSGPFFAGSARSVEVELTGHVYADELPQPAEFVLQIDFVASEKRLTVKALLDALKAFEASR